MAANLPFSPGYLNIESFAFNNACLSCLCQERRTIESAKLVPRKSSQASSTTGTLPTDSSNLGTLVGALRPERKRVLTLFGAMHSTCTMACGIFVCIQLRFFLHAMGCEKSRHHVYSCLFTVVNCEAIQTDAFMLKTRALRPCITRSVFGTCRISCCCGPFFKHSRLALIDQIRRNWQVIQAQLGQWHRHQASL